MPRINEFHQDTWHRPGISTYAKEGDFYSLTGLLPSPDGRQLRRAPRFISHTFATGLTVARAILYDEANNRILVIGQNATPNPACAYVTPATSTPWTWSGVTVLTAATTTLGGLHGRNAAWWGGYLWIIGADLKVYRGASYTAGLTEFYAGADAQLIYPYGDRMYMVSSDGTIYRTNDADDAFEAHYDPTIADVNIVSLAGYRQYLYAIEREPTGTLRALRIDSAEATTVTMEQTASIPAAATSQTWGCPFAQHGNHLYFSPGVISTPENKKEAPIYALRVTDASQIFHVTTLYVDVDDIFSLLSYNHDLLAVRLNNNSVSHKAIPIDEHSPRRIPNVASFSRSAGAYATPIAAVAGNHLVIAEAGGSMVTAGSWSGYNTTEDVMTTSYMDFGTSREKRLEGISLTLSEKPLSSVTVVIKYKTADGGSYVTAVTSAAPSTQRVEVTDLGIAFQQIKFYVGLTDTNAIDDVAIDKLSVLYTKPS